MKFRIRFAQQLVGVFILVAAVSLVAVLISMGANQRWFARDYAYHSVFPTARGLSADMSITYKGFAIGRVTDVTLTEEDEVRVDFEVQDTYRDKVVADSLLEVVSSPIGLGGGLVFYQGRASGNPLPEGSLVPAINSKEGQWIVDNDLAIITGSGDDISRTIQQLEPVLRSVNTVLSRTDETLGYINNALAGDTDEPMGVMLAQVNSLLREVETTVVATRDELTGLMASTAEIAANFEATSAELRDPTGLVPRLLDADGSVSTFLDDDNEVYDQVMTMLASVNATLAEVNALAEFVNGTQPQIAGILSEGQTTLDLSQDVLEGLRNNPLLRGGISEELIQPSTVRSYRDAQF